MTIESRKRACTLLRQVVDRLGYKFTPDEDSGLPAGQEVLLEQKHGIRFAPVTVTRQRAHDMTLVCPCIPFHRTHYDAMKRCWCGLFVHKDVTDPDALPQIPSRR